MGLDTIIGSSEELGRLANVDVNRRNFLGWLGITALGASLPEEVEAQRSGIRATKTNPQAKNDALIDSPLESRMDDYIKGKRRSGYLSSTDEISITVYDIGSNTKAVSINEDVARMAASTIKDYVMLAVFHQIKAGKLTYSTNIKSLVESMIVHSSNSATDKLLQILGGPKKAEEILLKNYDFFKQTRIIEYIPNSGATYKNTTSSHDLNKFYNQLWLGNLPHSAEMKRILALRKHNRIFNGTCIPNGTQALNKTGTVYGLVADSGILVMKDSKGNQHPYSINVMIEDRTKPTLHDKSGYTRWARARANVIRELSEGAYDFLYQRHTGQPFICKQHNGHHLGGRQ